MVTHRPHVLCLIISESSDTSSTLSVTSPKKKKKTNLNKEKQKYKRYEYNAYKKIDMLQIINSSLFENS